MKICDNGHRTRQQGCGPCQSEFASAHRKPEPQPNVFLGWLGASIAVFAFWWVLFALATWTW